MKRRINYFLILLIIGTFIVACSKVTIPDEPLRVLTAPEGIFSGTLTIVHTNLHTQKTDTARANTTLIMTLKPNHYVVPDDTTTIQAYSHGTYTADGVNITFIDSTLSFNSAPNPNLKKKHLYGMYTYQFDGTALQIYTQSDTLAFYYLLKKQ